MDCRSALSGFVLGKIVTKLSTRQKVVSVGAALRQGSRFGCYAESPGSILSYSKIIQINFDAAKISQRHCPTQNVDSTKCL